MADEGAAFQRQLRYVSFGEALVRFQPVPGQSWRGVPSAVSDFTRSVGGDELNVMVALSRLSCQASWVSVLPSGPLGDFVRGSAEDSGVDLRHLQTVAGSMGCFHVFPEERVTHFERGGSVFATQASNVFDWPAIVKERSRDGALVWMHQTGIAPMTGSTALDSWKCAMHEAHNSGVLISVDLNHRPALGTLKELWNIVEPELSKISLLILSVDSTFALAELLGLQVNNQDGPPSKKPCVRAGGVYSTEDDLNASISPLVEMLHERFKGPALACVMKTRNVKKRQQRWSLIVDAAGVHTTADVPTEHTPTDECGGGSAWAAGVIHSLSHAMVHAKSNASVRLSGVVEFPSGIAQAAIRRGDILAALSQETVGDHCVASMADVEAVEQRFQGKRAVVDGLPSRCQILHVPTTPMATRVRDALGRLDGAKVIAILRAKHESLAVARAMELADMGFKAVEVTADSAGFCEGTLLPAVVKAVGQRCLVGVGTITSPAELEVARSGGAHFALSPVRPTVGFGGQGFVAACHEQGILAMPAAYTPQEIYECVEEHGAFTVKIFPAQLWHPTALKDLRRIGNFSKYRLCPSGGIDCSNASAWLSAGAYAVGMGSCLVGKDVATDPSDTKALEAAQQDWQSKGRLAADAFAKTMFAN